MNILEIYGLLAFGWLIFNGLRFIWTSCRQFDAGVSEWQPPLPSIAEILDAYGLAWLSDKELTKVLGEDYE